jgi:hypothetical protein
MLHISFGENIVIEKFTLNVYMEKSALFGKRVEQSIRTNGDAFNGANSINAIVNNAIKW